MRKVQIFDLDGYHWVYDIWYTLGKAVYALKLNRMRFSPRLQNRIFRWIVSCVILPLFISSYLALTYSHNLLEQRNINQMQVNLDQFNVELNRVFNDMKSLSNLLTSDTKILSMLAEKTPANEYLKMNRFSTVNMHMSQMQNSVSGINTYITIIDAENNLYTTYNRLSGNTIVNDFQNTPMWSALNAKRSVWYAPHDNFNFEQPNSLSFISYARIMTVPDTSRRCGTVVVSVYTDDVITRILQVLPMRDQTTLVLNSESQVVLQGGTLAQMPDAKAVIRHINGYPQNTFHVKANGVDYLAVSKLNDTVSWLTLSLMPYDNALREIIILRKNYLILYSVVIGILLLVTWALAHHITKPLSALSRQMDLISDGNFNIALPQPEAKSGDETAQLSRNFYQMLGYIQRFIRESAQKQEEINRADIRALQSQIAPHFLFNTLNAIKWDAYLAGNRRTGDLIADLGSVYEAAIQRDSDSTTLREERNFITRYVSLMRLRYRSSVTLTFNLPDDLAECVLLRFILQPIVENSFVYGFPDNGGAPCEIMIACGKRDDSLVLTIQDNGIGIDAVRVAQINQYIHADEMNPTGSIALQNVHKRIRLRHGEAYGILIESVKGRYTRVIIELPLRVEGGQKQR